MHSPSTRPPEPQAPELVGVLYRTTSVPEIPSTPVMRLAVVVSIAVFVLVFVLAAAS